MYLPDEIMADFDVVTVMAENYGPICAAKQVSDRYSEIAGAEAENGWGLRCQPSCYIALHACQRQSFYNVNFYLESQTDYAIDSLLEAIASRKKHG